MKNVKAFDVVQLFFDMFYSDSVLRSTVIGLPSVPARNTNTARWFFIIGIIMLAAAMYFIIFFFTLKYIRIYFDVVAGTNHTTRTLI